jgi:hypothetical protein
LVVASDRDAEGSADQAAHVASESRRSFVRALQESLQF